MNGRPGERPTSGSKGLEAALSRRALLRGLGATALATAFAPALAACGGGGGSVAPSATTPAPLKADGDITLFTFNGYFDPAVLTAFTEQYGVNVKPVFYGDQDEAIKKLATGESYDVVVLSTTNIPRAAASNLLRPISIDEFSNADQLSAFFRNPTYDPGARFSVPYAVGAAGLMYRPDVVKGITGSWADMWNVRDADGHSFVLKDAATAMGMALLYTGHSASSSDPAEVEEASQALIELKPRLAGISSDGPSNHSGQSWLCQAWSGDAYQYQQTPDSRAITWTACKEGALFTADTWAIAASSRHPGSAGLFLNAMIGPEAATANVRAVGYPVPTTAGIKAFESIVAKSPELAVDPALFNDDSQWLAPLVGDRLKVISAAWSKVLAA